MKVTGTEPARAARAPVFSDIKAELAASGLRVEHRDDGSLKINLSSVGMFEFDSTRLSDSAGAELARIAGVLNRHAGAHVDVVGHTDSSGEPAYNVYLSQLRAEAVANYLIRMGLPEDRIQSEGRGDQDTRHEEATRDNPDLGRRVEIYIRPVHEG